MAISIADGTAQKAWKARLSSQPGQRHLRQVLLGFVFDAAIRDQEENT